MEPTPYAECNSEAPGLEATGKEGSPFQPGLDVGDVSRESMLAVLDKWSFAPTAVWRLYHKTEKESWIPTLACTMLIVSVSLQLSSMRS